MRFGPGKIAKFVVLALAAVAALGFVVEELWNGLLPPLFGWHAVTFWQALGLLLLSKILFGGFRGGRGHGGNGWKRRMGERWEKMTPEQRERFRAGMRGWCDRRPARAEETAL